MRVYFTAVKLQERNRIDVKGNDKRPDFTNQMEKKTIKYKDTSHEVLPLIKPFIFTVYFLIS